MPTYTYMCEQGGAKFEAFASIKKVSGWRPECPACGSQQTRQTFTAVTLIASREPASAGAGCCTAWRRTG